MELEKIAEDLKQKTLAESDIKLNTLQQAKFKQACKQVFIDNPGISIEDGLIASRIYLRLVVNFPDLELPLRHH